MEKVVEIPNGVTVDVAGRTVTVKGPKGSLSRKFSDSLFDWRTTIERADGKIVVKGDDRRKTKAFVGTIAAHIGNMISGVTHGYKYKLKIFHTHFPMTLEVKGKEVVVKNFLGERSIRSGNIVGNAKVEIKKDDVTVTGTDKEQVSQTAANIEHSCRLSGKDRRVFLDGVYITGWEKMNE